MKITVFEVEDWERERFAQFNHDHEVKLRSEPLSAKNVAEHADAEIVSTFIYSKLNQEVIEQLGNLKLIATRSTGFDHIPVDFCSGRGIEVCNVPTYGSETVAEHVFGLLLTISHKLEQAIDRTRKGDFSSRGLQGFDLRGKTLGVVGTGEIGLETIRIAKGFQMNVLGFDVKPNEEAAQKLGFRYLGLKELLNQSDIVTLHVPGNEQTRHLISRTEFEQMKPGVVLLNTSRGSIIETRELVRALADGKVSAAGLDVLPEEPVIREEAELLRSVYEERANLNTLLANHVLVHMRNVIVTPHSAFNTKEAVQRIIDTTIENIEAFIGGAAQNIVTKS